MSMVILSYIVYAMLSAENGMVNNSILKALHIDPVQWYQKPEYWPFILVIANCWKGVGYGCLIYIATLIGIDPTYYEAARLDGATKWQEIKKITLPCMVPTIITLLLLSIGRIFYSDFGLFYQVPMNSGVLLPTTNVIDTYVYRALIEQGNISMSSAAGVYQSLVGFAVVMVSNWVVRRSDKEKPYFRNELGVSGRQIRNTRCELVERNSVNRKEATQRFFQRDLNVAVLQAGL